MDEVLYVPAALALHQRPGVPGIRSTFGTGTGAAEQSAADVLPAGQPPLPQRALCWSRPLPWRPGQRAGLPGVRGTVFMRPSAEELAFNSQGACRTCSGTGIVRTVDEATLVPDESLTIDEGAVAPWNSLMWSLMTDVCREMGVRTDVPFRDLTDKEKDIVYHGPAEKKHIFYKAKNTNQAGELDFTYYNAVYTVENALAKVKDEKGMKRVEKFSEGRASARTAAAPVCPHAARAPKLRGITSGRGLPDDPCPIWCEWVAGVPRQPAGGNAPHGARASASPLPDVAARLLDLGLGYLSLDRAASTLSTGERQRMQLARAVRNRTTGVLYVLDEPSIGLHPSNIDGTDRRHARPDGRRQLSDPGGSRHPDSCRKPTG